MESEITNLNLTTQKVYKSNWIIIIIMISALLEGI